jgi:glycosyltransferase involved in cell wall biosynthesis
LTSTVAIFRKRLLSYSETFIADQGKFLPGFRPLYCGFQKDSSGLHLIDGSERSLLEDYSSTPGLSKLLFRRGLGGGGAWIEAIRRQAPRLIHAHFFNDGLDALRLGRKLGIPVVTTVHGHDITKNANAVAQSSGNRRFFSEVDRVIAVSNFIAQAALERGCPPAKLVQHYIGIDVEKFTLEKQESRRPSLLFVGRLVEKKGCTYLLQAMSRLKPRFPDLRLTIIGEGGLRAELQAEAEARELDVEFTGALGAERIRDELSRCWLFAAPSVTAASGDAEGLGMVFLEAQALGTPVVSFRSGGVVEAVEDGVTGLLCEERDVEQLAENIAMLLDNSGLRHNMGQQGRLRVTQQFDIRKQCASLERIYREVS